MTIRDTIVIAHGSLHSALRRELSARGLILRESADWLQADRSTPERILAVNTWFYEGLRHPLVVWRMQRWLRKAGIPLFAWNQDAPHYLNRAKWRLDWLDAMRWLDIYATHTLVDDRHFASSWMYLANAADTTHYNLGGLALGNLRDKSSYQYDVSFFGAMDGVRYKEMRARQEFFAALAIRLQAKGIRFLFREAAGMDIDDQIALIQHSRINLNFGASCDFGSPVASGLPERCYGIPACGGFLLCDRRIHARDDFTPGVDWAEFDGVDDCVAQIEHWLSNHAAARELAERCHALVLAKHTYAHRAELLHRVLLAWHGGTRGRLA